MWQTWRLTRWSMDEVGDIVVRISNEDFTDVILVIGDTYGDDDEVADEAKTLLM